MEKKKILLLFLIFITFFYLYLGFPKGIIAEAENCSSVTVDPGCIGSNTLTIQSQQIIKGEDYIIEVLKKDKGNILWWDLYVVNEKIDVKSGETGKLTIPFTFDYLGNYNINIKAKSGGEVVCKGQINIRIGETCGWTISSQNPIKGKELTVEINNIDRAIGAGGNKAFRIGVFEPGGNEWLSDMNANPIKYTPKIAGNYKFFLRYFVGKETIEPCSIIIRVGTEEEPGEISEPGTGTVDLGLYDLCQGNPDCEKCFTPQKDKNGNIDKNRGVYENGGAWTALGCIPTEPMDLVKWLFPYLLGFGGLAAFGLIVFSGFQLMTSSGDPQKIQGAKETITSAVTGLIFIILSLFLLRLIGVNILGLPGLK